LPDSRKWYEEIHGSSLTQVRLTGTMSVVGFHKKP
jgi:hypothetical protein